MFVNSKLGLCRAGLPAWSARASRPPRCTATRARTSASRRWTPQTGAVDLLVLPPTWPPQGWTSGCAGGVQLDVRSMPGTCPPHRPHWAAPGASGLAVTFVGQRWAAGGGHRVTAEEEDRDRGAGVRGRPSRGRINDGRRHWRDAEVAATIRWRQCPRRTRSPSRAALQPLCACGTARSVLRANPALTDAPKPSWEAAERPSTGRVNRNIKAKRRWRHCSGARSGGLISEGALSPDCSGSSQPP